MKLPTGFEKFVFTGSEDALHDLLKNGYIICPKTGILYNPKLGLLYQNRNGSSVFCEIESRSKFLKIQFRVKGSQETTEMNMVDFIWEIMTGEEPTKPVQLREGVTKYQIQWENFEMENPTYELQVGLFKIHEKAYNSKFIFRDKKDRSNFYKRSKIILDDLKRVIGGPPKKFISGVDYLNFLNDNHSSRKIRRSDGLPQN